MSRPHVAHRRTNRNGGRDKTRLLIGCREAGQVTQTPRLRRRLRPYLRSDGSNTGDSSPPFKQKHIWGVSDCQNKLVSGPADDFIPGRLGFHADAEADTFLRTATNKRGKGDKKKSSKESVWSRRAVSQPQQAGFTSAPPLIPRKKTSRSHKRSFFKAAAKPR